MCIHHFDPQSNVVPKIYSAISGFSGVLYNHISQKIVNMEFGFQYRFKVSLKNSFHPPFQKKKTISYGGIEPFIYAPVMRAHHCAMSTHDTIYQIKRLKPHPRSSCWNSNAICLF